LARTPRARLRMSRRARPRTAGTRGGRWSSPASCLCWRRCGSRAAIALDRAQHARVHEAAAEDARQRLLDLAVGRARVLIEKRLRGEDHAVQAEAALPRLLLDEGALDRMGPLRRAQPLEGRDLRAADAADRGHAGADRAAADDHGAGAALAEAAAEFRPAQREVVAEDVQERRCRVDVEGMRAAVDGERDGAHAAQRNRVGAGGWGLRCACQGLGAGGWLRSAFGGHYNEKSRPRRIAGTGFSEPLFL